MNRLFKNIFRWAGFDHAVSWTVAARTWGILAGPVGLWLIGTRLSPQSQGMYYLFANVVALKSFFELGLASVIMQVVSHESASVRLDANAPPCGEPEAIERVGSVLRSGFRYYKIASCGLFLVLAAGGPFFISSKSELPFSEWGIPWLMLAAVQSLALATAPFFATLEGLGQVGSVAWARLVENFLATMATCLVLVMGGALYAVPLGVALGLSWSICWLWLRRGHALKALWAATGAALPWRKEIWPLQWRIGIGWIFGYFIFETFVPVVMAYRGDVEAGRMGMSLSAVIAIVAISMAWLNSKSQKFGMLIASRDWDSLDRVFFASAWRGGVVLIAGFAAVICGILALHHWHVQLAGRMLSPVEICLLCGVGAANYIFFATVVYLRSFKQEPFLAMGIVNGLLIFGSLMVVVPAWGTFGACAAYLTIQAGVTMPWAVILFIRKRKEYMGR